MTKQKFNLHTHTYRCGHAIKTEDDYIQTAIENNFEALGFSEHCGYKGFDDPYERIAFDKMDKYFEDIKRAKDSYKNKIKVYTGLEFEYFDDKLSYLNYVKKKCDYMIIGQHMKDRLGYDYSHKCTDKDVRYMAYQICSALEQGLSRYVAHPDYFMLSRKSFSKECETAIREIVQCANKHNAVVEINLKGMRYGIKDFGKYKSYIYPHIKTLEIYKQENANVVIGYDAHNPNALSQTEYEENAKNIVKELNYFEDYEELISVNK